MEPINLTATKESRDSVAMGLMTFQRFAKRQNRGIPPALRDGLQELVLQPDLRGLYLGGTFHLISHARRGDSSATISIFEFDASTSETMLVRGIKANYQDKYYLNVRTGALSSIIGWQMGRHEEHSTVQVPAIADSRSLLLEHWINPKRWMDEGRLVVVRPGDLALQLEEEGGEENGAPKRVKNGVAVCQSAITCLSKGFTLLLVKGDLIGVPLPWKERGPMLVAGLMFKEGQSQEEQLDPLDPPISGKRPTNGRSTNRRKPRKRQDELCFIIAERAQRRTKFSGVQAQEIDRADKTGHQFVEGMYVWQEHDLYSYFPGKWGG